ncbi:hypothetical protein Taro_034080 [Colocasia esculenta]|uniref:Uncharacterized protein n=1 Tax=Colocasia esculenta TaxID=4460 RepID=A0A843VVJ0_COLES|nr:hypothetical protein [Colocasia esculenta]
MAGTYANSPWTPPEAGPDRGSGSISSTRLAITTAGLSSPIQRTVIKLHGATRLRPAQVRCVDLAVAAPPRPWLASTPPRAPRSGSRRPASSGNDRYGWANRQQVQKFPPSQQRTSRQHSQHLHNPPFFYLLHFATASPTETRPPPRRRAPPVAPSRITPSRLSLSLSNISRSSSPCLDFLEKGIAEGEEEVAGLGGWAADGACLLGLLLYTSCTRRLTTAETWVEVKDPPAVEGVARISGHPSGVFRFGRLEDWVARPLFRLDWAVRMLDLIGFGVWNADKLVLDSLLGRDVLSRVGLAKSPGGVLEIGAHLHRLRGWRGCRQCTVRVSNARPRWRVGTLTRRGVLLPCGSSAAVAPAASRGRGCRLSPPLTASSLLSLALLTSPPLPINTPLGGGGEGNVCNGMQVCVRSASAREYMQTSAIEREVIVPGVGHQVFSIRCRLTEMAGSPAQSDPELTDHFEDWFSDDDLTLIALIDVNSDLLAADSG